MALPRRKPRTLSAHGSGRGSPPGDAGDMKPTIVLDDHWAGLARRLLADERDPRRRQWLEEYIADQERDEVDPKDTEPW